MGGGGGGGNPQAMQSAMQQMMQSPMMQSMMENPDLIRTVLQAHPGVREVNTTLAQNQLCCAVVGMVLVLMPHCMSCVAVHPLMYDQHDQHAECPCCAGFLQLMERSPELAQVLNNPDMLRESMRLMSNPVSEQPHLKPNH